GGPLTFPLRRASERRRRNGSPIGHNCLNSVDTTSGDSIAWHTLSGRMPGEGYRGDSPLLRIAVRLGGTRRAVALGAAVLLAGGLAVAATQVAGAQPQPSINQVQATINTLTGEFNKANQQYDQVEE